jgi:hypothetical protein
LPPIPFQRFSIDVRIPIASKYRREFSAMHYGSKGWYVEELKKLGMTKYEGRKLQSYKKHFLANLLESVKK